MDRELPTTGLSPEMIENLLAEPWNYSFFALMRRICANPAIDPVGTACQPQAEPFRLGQKPSLAFAPSEIADARIKHDKLGIRLFSLGMLGPNGPLPIHVTEIAREREEWRGDSTLCDFLDIFHHRYLTLLYRTWAVAQATASLDRPDDDYFSFCVACLSGHLYRPERAGFLPSHPRLAVSSHLVRESRNVDGLRQTLAYYFGVPVCIEEWSRHWIVLPSELQCCMGERSSSATLGGGAMLGEQVSSGRHRFCIVIGPLDIGTYHDFTPRGDNLLPLIMLVRMFVGLEYEWLLELQIKPGEATPAVLGDNQRLGWSGWLGESPTGDPVVGMCFEPEPYMEQLVKNSAGER